jgi:hypothetical protein
MYEFVFREEFGAIYGDTDSAILPEEKWNCIKERFPWIERLKTDKPLLGKMSYDKQPSDLLTVVIGSKEYFIFEKLPNG